MVRFPQQDSAERAFNKLARTFAAQVETLKRYRGGDEQTMPRGVATALGGHCAPHRHAPREIVRRGLIRGEIPLYGGAGLAAGLAKLMQAKDDNNNPSQ